MQHIVNMHRDHIVYNSFSILIFFLDFQLFVLNIIGVAPVMQNIANLPHDHIVHNSFSILIFFLNFQLFVLSILGVALQC